MTSKLIAILGLVITVIVLLFGNNLIGRFLVSSDKKNKVEVNSNENKERDEYKIDTLDILVEDEKLPYLKKVPILDKSLFIEYYYTDFRFGGVNLELVKFNAMSDEAEVLKIEYDKESQLFKMPIFDKPQLEFKYKESIYAIIVENKFVNSFYYSITELSNSRMQLNKSKNQFKSIEM